MSFLHASVFESQAQVVCEWFQTVSFLLSSQLRSHLLIEIPLLFSSFHFVLLAEASELIFLYPCCHKSLPFGSEIKVALRRDELVKLADVPVLDFIDDIHIYRAMIKRKINEKNDDSDGGQIISATGTP